MFEGLIKDFAMGTARHLATLAAGYLVSDGILMGSQTNDFLGAVLFFVALGFSAYDKIVGAKQLAAATSAKK